MVVIVRKRIRYIGHAGTLRITGAETGTPYVFAGHGSIVRVYLDDVAALLALTSNSSGCCGAGPQTAPLFTLA